MENLIEHRCVNPSCRSLLFKSEGRLETMIEYKCRHCKKVQKVLQESNVFCLVKERIERELTQRRRRPVPAR